MQPSKEIVDILSKLTAYMVTKSSAKHPCIFIVRWRVTSQKLANRGFPGFLEKVKKIMLTIFSFFFEKTKVYGLHGLTTSFFANLQKTFHFWTFLKCPKTGYGAPSIKYPKMTFRGCKSPKNRRAYLLSQ